MPGLDFHERSEKNFGDPAQAGTRQRPQVRSVTRPVKFRFKACADGEPDSFVGSYRRNKASAREIPGTDI